MQITNWSPFGGDNQFNNFDKEFEKFFKELMPLSSNNVQAPSMNMYQKDDNLILDMIMPAIDSDNVSIDIDEDNVMTVKGSSKKQLEVDDKNYYRKEIRTGTFFRRIQLPYNVDGEKAKAIYNDGVLSVSIPMLNQKKIKKIQVEKIEK